MKIHLRFTFVFAVLSGLLLANSVFAQHEYTSSDPKAVRLFDDALRLYDSRKSSQALQRLDDALKADPQFVEAYMLKANIYSDLRDYPNAIVNYKKAIEINPGFFPNNYFSLGEAEFSSGLFDDAKSHFEQFITYPKITKTLLNAAKQKIENCAFASEAVKNPVPFEPVNMGDSINSPDEEYFPAITGDGKTFLFTRRLPCTDAAGRPSMQEDFYISHLVNNNWTHALPVTEINSAGNEGAPSLSADGQYLFFTACKEVFESSASWKTKGSCDLFISKKVGDHFTNPRNLEEPVNSGTWESQPSFSSDGRTLYFIRKVKEKDGRNQRDIFMTHIGDNSSWSEPVVLSDKINTPGDELSVFIHPDDQTLYFSSDGHAGMGGLDIFMSRRQEDGSWGEAVNLGYPINTQNDENSLLVSPNGKVGYFASDRAGGKGKLDLYQFNLYEKVRPIPVTYMKGKVFDAETKKVLSAGFELIDLATDKSVVNSTSNPGNGEFLVCLPTGKSFALNVSKDGYLFYSENFSLKDPKSANEPFIKDIALKPIKAGQSIVLKNIFFDFDKYELKEESHIELEKLIQFMNKNPQMKIEIGGHTDNVGGKQYNQQLSQNRAKAVYDYLITKSILSTRLTFKGYGDTKPVAENTTEQGRAQNRRTEFTVVEIK